MNFVDAVKSVLVEKYATFTGRARRSEYWYFWLFNFVVGLVLGAIFFALSWIWSLAVLIPGLAVSVRRLHDTGRSGWNLLWALLPIIGSIIVLVFLVQDSREDNQYGPNPKAATV